MAQGKVWSELGGEGRIWRGKKYEGREEGASGDGEEGVGA
jgi:hypothetical protein